jgi:hypothetical protein
MNETQKEPTPRRAYECKRHGQIEPLVSLRKNGYIHRRCPTCLSERFDKAEWQRQRRKGIRDGRPPNGRTYAPKAQRLEDLPVYECKVHGKVDPIVVEYGGRIHRSCSVCRNAGKVKRSVYQRKYAQQLRAMVIEAYGSVCRCCGISEARFLSVDHVHSDGHEARKVHGVGAMFYSWLKRAGFPQEGFQLLCFNCNLGRAFNNGICPHVSGAEGDLK